MARLESYISPPRRDRRRRFDACRDRGDRQKFSPACPIFITGTDRHIAPLS